MSFDIQDWLVSIGLPQYGEDFAAQDLDRNSKADLSDADLRELGVPSMGHLTIIFLSYAHKSERAEDFDISADLVTLIRS